MTKTIYRNKRNEHKFLEVVTYDPGHVYMVQFIRWDNGIVNRVGDNRRHRVSRDTLSSILDDYEEAA